MEQIYNYLDMPIEQRKTALNSLSSIGFCPAYGKVKTMQNVMDKSIAGQMPQFYFAFRDTELIGYIVGRQIEGDKNVELKFYVAEM